MELYKYLISQLSSVYRLISNYLKDIFRTFAEYPRAGMQ